MDLDLYARVFWVYEVRMRNTQKNFCCGTCICVLLNTFSCILYLVFKTTFMQLDSFAFFRQQESTFRHFFLHTKKYIEEWKKAQTIAVFLKNKHSCFFVVFFLLKSVP